MITRAKSFKKRSSINERWSKQQGKNNKISAKLINARQCLQSITKTKKSPENVELRMRDIAVQTINKIKTKSIKIQAKSKTRDVSVTTTSDTKEVCVQTIRSKTKSIATQANNCILSSRILPTSPTNGRPRRPLENLSNVRISQVAKELANFHRERTPNAEGNPITYDVFRLARRSLNVFTPNKEGKKKLTVYQELYTFLSAGISFHGREKLKKTLEAIGFDIFVSNREFYTTENKISANLSIKWTAIYLNCVNIKKVVERRIEQLLLTDMFVGFPTFVLMGDKGASITKIGILPVIKYQTNAPNNLSIISIWEGDDNRKFLQENKELFEQLSKINNVKWILTGDLKFLSAILSHRGAASSNPCCICRAPKENLENKGIMRNYNVAELSYSFVDTPLFPIKSEHVMPPPLHITHGISTRAINILECLIEKQILTDFLQNNNIRRDPHTKTFRGNDLVKLLQIETEEHSLSKLVTVGELQKAAALWNKLIEGVRWWFTISCAKVLDDPMEQADFIEKGANILFRMFKVLKNHLETVANNESNELVRNLAKAAAKKARPFPKLHYLRHHCADFIRNNGWWGVASEQAYRNYVSVTSKIVKYNLKE